MTQNQPPPIPNLIPESAPFSTEQRQWLNGFFAGYLGLDAGSFKALSADESAALMAGMMPSAKGRLDDNDDGEAPWHDPSLPMTDRMQLADGRPLRRRGPG